jgi:hypothetical protein
LIKIHSGFYIVGFAALSLVTATAGILCSSWGLDDPQSGSGFFSLSFCFFIQALGRVLNIRFGEGDALDVLEDLFKAVNQLLAMTMIIINAVPHPQFTGVLLWSGVALLLLHSAVKNLWEIGEFFWEEIQSARSARVENKKRIQAEIEITKTMQAERAKMEEAGQIEHELLLDLTDFLANKDNGKK